MEKILECPQRFSSLYVSGVVCERSACPPVTSVILQLPSHRHLFDDYGRQNDHSELERRYSFDGKSGL